MPRFKNLKLFNICNFSGRKCFQSKLISGKVKMLNYFLVSVRRLKMLLASKLLSLVQIWKGLLFQFLVVDFLLTVLKIF